MKRIRDGWLVGKPSADATTELLQSIRTGSPADTSELTVKLLNEGVAPQSIFEGLFDGAGELLMQAPGILSLHATTFTNAMRYVWQRVQSDETRRLLLLQNAAFMRHPCPVLPTRHLVVKGSYRYVRNPMYLAVVSVILGQGMILGSVSLLAYGAIVWLELSSVCFDLRGTNYTKDVWG